ENYLIASSHDIAKDLTRWLHIIVSSYIAVDEGLSASFDYAGTEVDSTAGEISLYDIISKSFKNCRGNWSGEQIKRLPEHAFFTQNLSPGQEQETLATFRHVFSNIPLSKIISILNENNAGWYKKRHVENLNDNLFTELELLHRDCNFPIIPYLPLVMLGNYYVHHCVIPLLHSQQFPLEVPTSISKSGIHTCVLVFLGTIITKTPKQPPDDILPFMSLLMRRMAEPLVDTVFYGGIQRKLAESAGTWEAMRVFAHQVKAVAYGASEGWLVTPERWELIENKLSNCADFSKIRNNYLIAPVPDLFRALKSTMLLWSMSYSPNDIFPEGRLPTDLSSLSLISWNYAIDNRFVASCINRNFRSNSKDLVDAINHRMSELRNFDFSELRSCKISASIFTDNDGKTCLSPDNEQSYIQLTMVLRVLVVVCENFLQHSENNATLKVYFQKNGNKIHLTCVNKRKSNGSQSIPSNHLGFRGTGLIKYLCKNYLEADVQEDRKSHTDYSICIILTIPAWMEITVNG
ncbi:MAG: hypothetical protein ACYC58_09160, partial [Pseudomonadaceae bacterium]